jgi:prepilin-type N-terminal cleavage/methylation domain-containing protein
MKSKKGFTLIEMMVVLVVLSIVCGFMVNIFFTSMRTSLQNQMTNEARMLGTSIRNFLEEELIYATKITINETKSTDIKDSHISIETDWIHSEYAGSGVSVPLLGGQDVSPGTTISLVVDKLDDSTTDDITSTKYNSLELTLKVIKNGATYFTDSFYIKNINSAEITDNHSSGDLFINYQKPTPP